MSGAKDATAAKALVISCVHLRRWAVIKAKGMGLATVKVLLLGGSLTLGRTDGP